MTRSSNHKKSRLVRNVVGVVSIAAAVASACSLPEQTEIAQPTCGVQVDVADLDRSNGDSTGLETHVILHAGQDHNMDAAIGRIVSSAAVHGHRMVAWRLQSSSAATLAELGSWDLSGESNNKLALGNELADLGLKSACELLDALDTPPTGGDKGADLAGALAQVMRKEEVANADGATRILLLTEGGVHRTQQLDLGDPMTESDDWESAVEALADAGEQSSATAPLEIEIRGVGTSREPLAAKVRENTQLFWDDICSALNDGRTSCSPHS